MKGPFQAVAYDNHGGVMSGEAVKEWLADPDESDYEIEEIKVVTGTALPEDGYGPGSYRTLDVVVEHDVFGYEGHEVKVLWKRAKLISRLLNQNARRSTDL